MLLFWFTYLKFIDVIVQIIEVNQGLDDTQIIEAEKGHKGFAQNSSNSGCRINSWHRTHVGHQRY